MYPHAQVSLFVLNSLFLMISYLFSRSPTILGQLVSIGMKVVAKMVGLSRCNGKEGKVYDGMDTFVTLNLSRSRG